MTTALQRQLAAIAVKSTHQLDLRAQKAQHSKSLLFVPRVAAGQSFDTIYQVCFEGFEELCQLDLRFAHFSRSLFSEQSKNEDRTQMTALENTHLDSLIERFLGLVGGRLLLKPAVKAVEWLIRRFRVHEYNTEALLLSFLPYHQSTLFPTLLSILPDQLPPNFRFLNPYVTSLQSPPRHAIVAATSNTPALFAAFSQYVMNVARAKQHSSILLGFWASITAQAVNSMIDTSRSGRDAIRRQKEEDLLLKVLPVLHDSLTIKGVPELYLGSCMIMTILATKTSLSDKALDSMLEAVAAGWTEQTINEGVLCLAVLAEEKEAYSPLPQSVSRAMLSRNDLFAVIDQAAAKCRIRKLITGIYLGALLGKQDKKASEFLTATFEAEFLAEQDKIDLLQMMLTKADFRDDPTTKTGVLAVLMSLTEHEQGSQLINSAAQQANLDLAIFDANLALQLMPNILDESTQEIQQPELGVDVEESQLELSLDHLPKISVSEDSFLTTEQDKTFGIYLESFQQAFSGRVKLSAFLTLLSTSQPTSKASPCLLSFLTRAWSSDASSTSRVKALQVASDVLQKARRQENPGDMQLLLPFVLTALADTNKAIRMAAASVCLSLMGNQKTRTKQSQSANEIDVWASQFFYGKESAKISLLSPADAHKLIADVVHPVLEDCMIDSSYIVSTITDTINATSMSNKTNKRELKLASRTAIYGFLTSHVVAAPDNNIRLRLLPFLSKVGKAAGSVRVHTLLPFVRSCIEQPREQTGSVEYISLITALVACISHRTSDEIEFLKSLASGECGDSTTSELGFQHLQRLWSYMPEATQAGIIDWLLNLSLASETPEDVHSASIETMRGLSLPKTVLVHMVENIPTIHELQGQETHNKKQRTSRASEMPKSGSVEKEKLGTAVRRLTTILELVEASDPGRHPQLLRGLFHLLSELHLYKALLDSELTYLQALLINSLLLVVKGLKNSSDKDIDRSVIRPDLIVDCVRSTSSTQVHQSALLLMSALASWAPDLVLHSVMPLFTFMSSTILKQGDDYSAHVTDQTVARIVPPLAASLKKRGKDLVTGAADLLLSFTAAFEHIPLHRRAGLFRHLVQTLGPTESLSAIVAMLVERYSDEEDARPFVAKLMGNFPMATQLSASEQYLDLVSDTLKHRRALSDTILGFAEKSNEQATQATNTLIDGLASILARRDLRIKLAKELTLDEPYAESLRVAYSVMLEKTMQLGLQLESSKSFRPSIDNLLASLLGLMPSKDFINSSAKLMQTGSDEIRQQVFQSLEQRVETTQRGDSALQQVFVEVLPNCAVFVTPTQAIDTRVAAIACIDRIAEKFGKTDRTAVAQAAEQIAGTAALGSTNSNLRRMSILCLASAVEVLEDEFIAILPRVMEITLEYMREIIDADDGDAALLAACFSFCTAVLDHIPWMLTGTYLDQLLVLAADADDQNSREFLDLASRKVGAREILSAIDRTWDSVVQHGADAARLQLTTLRSVILHQPKSVISKNSQVLFTTLFKAFDLRRYFHDIGENGNDSTEVFELVSDTTMKTVLKLNDATFRPFFVRLSEWAAKSLPKQDATGRIFRQTSFYSFLLTFFDQLKSLVTVYVSYILEDAASILRDGCDANRQNVELVNLVARVLSSNFHQDQDGFWQSPAHFNIVVEPLLDILEQAGGFEVNSFVIPAIVELASAANSPEHHKTIDDKLLVLMRHEAAAVRLAVIKAEQSLTERLSFDWCNFIPAWLPFIAELQEDDDAIVERETLRWMEQIQNVTGESVNDMLR